MHGNAQNDSSHISNEATSKQCNGGVPLQAYLPDAGGNCDHEGSPLRVRPSHCTSIGLTPAITPNVGNSSV